MLENTFFAVPYQMEITANKGIKILFLADLPEVGQTPIAVTIKSSDTQFGEQVTEAYGEVPSKVSGMLTEMIAALSEEESTEEEHESES